METVRQIEENNLIQNNDDSSEDIFFGPITKREITSKLKHFNFYNDELLEPLQKLQDNDVLDNSLIKYYDDIIPKGNEDNSISQCASPIREKHVEDLDNINSSASTGIYKDSLDLDLTGIESLTESQLLKKYFLHEQSFVKNEEKDKEREEISKNYTINIEKLRINEKESVETRSQMLNSSINSTSISINSTLEKSESVLFHSSPEKSESEYSYLKSDNSGFNCTLEEMEMFLKYGENYMTENKSISVSMKSDKIDIEKKEKENKSPICSKKNTHDIINIDKRSVFENKENPILTQKITPQPHRTFKQITTPTPSHFKLPSKTISKKSPNYKNIVSPVAMYIKRTPKVPLIQNVSKKSIQLNTFRDISSTEDDNLQEAPIADVVGSLPIRSYKPALKSALLSQEEEPALPRSIQRYMKCSTPQVIKHIGRVQVHQVPDRCVLEELHDNNMTMLSNSQTNIEGDVSVYVSKNAARSNRLLDS